MVDFDLHDDFFDDVSRIEILKQKYNSVIEIIGARTTLLVQTRTGGGLHACYKLDKKIHYTLLNRGIKALGIKIKAGAIEVLPTPTQAARFPGDVQHGGKILDTCTLEEIPHNGNMLETIHATIKNAPVLNTALIAGHSADYSTVKKQQFVYRHYTELPGKIKDCLKSIRQGETNAGIQTICRAAIPAGLTDYETAEKINTAIEENKIQRKNDTTEKAILRRVKWHYKTFKKITRAELENKYKVKKHYEPDLLQIEKITETIQNYENTFGKLYINRRRGLYNFLADLLTWHDYIDKLPAHEKLLFDNSYQYFYYYTHKLKLTPLPRKLLGRFNQRYYYYMPRLARLGFIRLVKKSYNPYKAKVYNPEMLGRCAYYKIGGNHE